MGDCKDQMTMDKKDDKKDVKDSLLGFLPRKKKREVEDDDNTPKKFANYIQASDDMIGKMIVQKATEFSKEKGDEEYNSKALALLKTIQFHVDEIIDNMADYGELRSRTKK